MPRPIRGTPLHCAKHPDLQRDSLSPEIERALREAYQALPIVSLPGGAAMKRQGVDELFAGSGLTATGFWRVIRGQPALRIAA